MEKCAKIGKYANHYGVRETAQKFWDIIIITESTEKIRMLKN